MAIVEISLLFYGKKYAAWFLGCALALFVFFEFLNEFQFRGEIH